MKIKIVDKVGSVTEDTEEFDTAGYCVFAGENNSGKTNLILSIKKELEKQKKKVIYIPAEKISYSDEMSTTNQTNPMYKAISKLIDLEIADSAKINGESKLDSFIENIKSTFKAFDVKNMELDFDKKMLTKDEMEEVLKVETVKRILNPKVIDKNINSEIPLESFGSGTHRLLAVSLIKELGQNNISINKDVYLLFEEPEVYLNPRLKKNLHDSLSKLSESINVVITTHDPFFIQLGGETEKLRIYDVFRNSKKNGSTDVRPVGNGTLLNYVSYAETNWKIFKLATPEYLLQLHQKAFDDKLTIDKHQTEIRNRIGHTTVKKERKGGTRNFPTAEEIINGIEYFEKLLKQNKTQ